MYVIAKRQQMRGERACLFVILRFKKRLRAGCRCTRVLCDNASFNRLYLYMRVSTKCAIATRRLFMLNLVSSDFSLCRRIGRHCCIYLIAWAALTRVYMRLHTARRWFAPTPLLFDETVHNGTRTLYIFIDTSTHVAGFYFQSPFHCKPLCI